MRYWRIEIEFPNWCMPTYYYFEAATKEAAMEMAQNITDDEASNTCRVYFFAETEEDQEEFIENTTFKLTEVSYEEAKDHF